MNVFESIVRGVVQGLTEFLPISSAGHLVFMQTLFNVESINTLPLESALYLAITTAVITYFRKDIWLLTQALLRKLGRLPVNKREETLLYAVAAAAAPIMVLGFLLENLIGLMFRSPLLIAGVLITGSFFFMYAEWVYQKQIRTNEITVKKGFKIGLFQTLSLIPGVSLSGPSICGGMFLGLSRHESARFSFLLAIPLTLGAGLKKTLELITSDAQVDWIVIGVGAGVAFAVSIMAIHFMLSFLQRHTLWPFIWYRIILAFFIVFIFMFG